MSDPISRRNFLAAAGLTGLTAANAAAFGRRCRPACPPRPCPPLPGPIPGPTPPPDDGLRVRQNVTALSAAQLDSLRRGVEAMKALPESDRRSWRFQASMHGATGTATDPLFNQCEHGTEHFLSWHRAYLLFFERILRSLSGDPALSLPYWDWVASPTVPDALRLEPAANPLWHSGRVMNDGSPLLPEDVAGLTPALAAGGYAGPLGFNSRLEGNPHGAVHVAVGGDMGAVPTAARDPLFWLHHANVDRLWDVWLGQGGGRANPADAGWVNKTYSFADESGAAVSVRVGDYASSAALGYRYDTTPRSGTGMTIQAAVVPTAAAVPKVVAASAPADQPLDKVESKPLGYAVERVRVKPASPAARTVMAAPPAADAGWVLIRLEGVSAAAPPGGVRYGVYLNPPAEALGGDDRLRYHIGTINFFGKTKRELKAPGHGHAKAGGDTFDETFDATAVVAALRKAERWDPDAVDVVIMPIGSGPAGQSKKELEARTQAAVKEAEVRYKRVTVLQN